MSLYRCVVRLRDHLGLRADKDPGARGVFSPQIAEAEGRRPPAVTPTSPTTTPTSPTAVSRRRLTKKPRPSKTPDGSPPGTDHQAAASNGTENATAKDKGKRQGTEVFPGFNFGWDDQATGTGSGTKLEGENSRHVEKDDRDADSGQRRRRRPAPGPSPGNLSKSSTVSSFLDSKRSEARRRKRKKSDSRPGYFDPGPFADDTTGTGSEVETGGDSLIMNIPVALRNRY